MNIYIISLKNSPRRPGMIKALTSLNLKFEFIDAIDKHALTPEKPESHYDVDAVIKRHRRKLTIGEVACFKSHIKAWTIAAGIPHPSIILEDDALLRDNIKTIINSYVSTKQFAWDVLLLGKSKLPQRKERNHYFHNPIVKTEKHHALYVGAPFKLWSSGMVGYIVTPLGAQKLIHINQRIRCVSDDWSFHSEHGVTVQEVRPYVILEDYENILSTIECERIKFTRPKNILAEYALTPIRLVRAIYRNLIATICSKPTDLSKN